MNSEPRLDHIPVTDTGIVLALLLNKWMASPLTMAEIECEAPIRSFDFEVGSRGIDIRKEQIRVIKILLTRYSTLQVGRLMGLDSKEIKYHVRKK